MNNTIKIDGIEYNLVPIEKKVEVKQKVEKECTIGDWIVFNGGFTKNVIRKVIKIDDYNNIGSLNLDIMYGDWMTENATKGFLSSIKLATKEEIQTHLIALAKKKGYNTAKKVISVMHYIIYKLKFNELTYNHRNDILSDGVVSIYQNGKWAEIVKEEEKKFTFGGQEVKIENDIYNTYIIKCKNETGTFNQLSNIILNPFTIQSFGNVCTKSLMTLATLGHFTLTNNPIDKYENLITSISIGCLVGNYSELLDIYNHILELKNK